LVASAVLLAPVHPGHQKGSGICRLSLAMSLTCTIGWGRWQNEMTIEGSELLSSSVPTETLREQCRRQ
jgi:hypothetical protein